MSATAERETKLHLLDVHEMLTTEPDPIEWVAEPLAARGFLTILSGREGLGKSMLALAIGIRMASGGGPFAGLNIAPGRVLLVDAENDVRLIQRRLHELGCPADAESQIYIAESDADFDFRSSADREDLAKLIDRVQPNLVNLDCMRYMWTGDENDPSEAPHLAALTKLFHKRFPDTAGILIHHANKATGHTRGSTAIAGAFDASFDLMRAESDPQSAQQRKLRRLTCGKLRFEEEPEDVWILIE